MEPNESWPECRLALVDMVPKPIRLDEPATTLEYFQDFVFALFELPSESLPSGLERVQAGASDIVHKIPSLRDPAKGGRLDLNQLRVRMLTGEMVEAVFTSRHEWPFRYPETTYPKYFRTRMMGKKMV